MRAYRIARNLIGFEENRDAAVAKL